MPNLGSKESSKVLYFKDKDNKLVSKLSESEKLPSEKDLFSSIKCLLLVGRLLFLLPCDGLNWDKHEKFVFRKNSFPTIASLVLITWNVFKTLISLKYLIQVSHGGVVGYAHPAHYFLISSIITFIYLYLFLTTSKLKDIFAQWNKLVNIYDLQVFSIRRMTFWALLSMILPFIINSLFVIDGGIYRLDGKGREIPENFTSLEYAYVKLLQNWSTLFPYYTPTSVFFALDFIYNSLPRSYIFSMVVVFSYMISRQFKDLLESGERSVRGASDSGMDDEFKRDNDEVKFWVKLVKKHDVLSDFAEKVDSYLSPLIFITYLTSLYLICMQLLRALSPATGLASGDADALTLGLSPFIYQSSFCVESFLIYFLSVCAAQVNDYAHRIGHVLRMCPVKYHLQEVARLEARVNSGPRIGLSGLSCFVITKPFLLTIANAVITLEIVLLQAQVSQPFKIGN